MKKIVVTGGAGFIGSHLTEALLKEGYSVTVIDDLSTGYETNLSRASGADFVNGSILDQTGILRPAMKDADAVFHLAAIASVPRSVKDPLLSHSVNATGTLMVFDEALRAGVKRVVFASSSSSVGDVGDRPRTESLYAVPQSPYSVAKYSGELYAKVYSHIHPIDIVSLRYFNVFGARQRLRGPYSNIIPVLFEAGYRDSTVTVYGDGEQTRDFTYIDDIVRGNLLALGAEDVAGLTINIGSGRSVSVLYLARAVEKILGRSLKIRHAAQRPEDIRHIRVDSELATAKLGFSAETQLEDGLAATADWFRDQLARNEYLGESANIGN